MMIDLLVRISIYCIVEQIARGARKMLSCFEYLANKLHISFQGPHSFTNLDLGPPSTRCCVSAAYLRTDRAAWSWRSASYLGRSPASLGRRWRLWCSAHRLGLDRRCRLCRHRWSSLLGRSRFRLGRYRLALGRTQDGGVADHLHLERVTASDAKLATHGLRQREPAFRVELHRWHDRSYPKKRRP